MAFARHPPSRTEPGPKIALLARQVSRPLRTGNFGDPAYAWVADETSTETPGPMVEDSETFFT